MTGSAVHCSVVDGVATITFARPEAMNAIDDEFAARVATVAAALAAGPTLAYASMRRSVGYAATYSLEESLDVEAEMMARTGRSADHPRAMAAFLAKQRPVFDGF